MAKHIFHSMKIEYSKLKVYLDLIDFKQFIFQAVNEDTEKEKGEFVLIAYASTPKA